MTLVDEARAAGRPLSVGLLGNAAEIFSELVGRGVVPDVVTDQTSAHDALGGYVPAGMDYSAALALRHADPAEYVRRSTASMVAHVQAMVALQDAGSIVFDYGNNLRGMALAAGYARAFEYPGFVPAYIRPLFCEGKGPFRWAALSGEPADIARTDQAILEFVSRRRAAAPLDHQGPGAGAVSGSAGPNLLAWLR
jgi:urocanate hydratase